MSEQTRECWLYGDGKSVAITDFKVHPQALYGPDGKLKGFNYAHGWRRISLGAAMVLGRAGTVEVIDCTSRPDGRLKKLAKGKP